MTAAISENNKAFGPIKYKHNGITFNISDPAIVEYAERNAFIKSLESKTTAPDREVAELVIEMYYDFLRTNNPKAVVSAETVQLAHDYARYAQKGARLPKFSRWATGMFRDDKQLAQDLARAGKYVERSGDIVISGSLIDILRAADTPHFTSCLQPKDTDGYGYGYNYILPAIAEKPGIAIAYVDGEDGKMRGRCWVHSAKEVGTGLDCAVVCTKWGGTVDAEQIVKLLRSQGHRAYVGGSYGRQEPNGLAVNFYDCFTEELHHDMYTWVKDFKVQK